MLAVPWVLALLSVTTVCLISLAGLATLSMDQARVRRIAASFVAFAAGALLGDAFLHLIPDAFEHHDETWRPSMFMLGGLITFFIAEKLLRHRHSVEHVHAYLHEAVPSPLAAISILGDAIHNFIDGALIGASYLASPALGVSTTVAVLLHEIPQELGDFGILVHSGLSVRQAVLFNLASASAAIAGTVLALGAGAVAGDAVATVMVPFTAGGFVYFAAADLMPELQHDHSLRSLWTQTSLIALGIGVMGLLALME